MNNISGMHEGDPLADLSHKAHTRFLGQQEVITDSSFEQFTAVNTTIITITHSFNWYIYNSVLNIGEVNCLKY